MHSLAEFPAEILLDIFEALGDSSAESNADLARLCRTCRSFRDLVRPILYATVHLHSSEDGSFKNIIRLLHTLSLNPQLIKNVKCLHLDTGYPMNARGLTGMALVRLLDPSNFRGAQGWLPSEEERPKFEDLAKKLLSRLISVEHLTLVLKDKHPRDLLRYIYRQRGIGAIPILMKLKTFRIIKEYDTVAIELSENIDLMKLPSLEELRLDIRLDVGAISSVSRNVLSHTKIELNSCIIDRSGLTRLLGTCHYLESFTYNFPTRPGSEVPIETEEAESCFFTPLSLGNLLYNHNTTLKQFATNFYGLGFNRLIQWDWEYLDFDPEDTLFYPSFGSFGNLTRMSIDRDTIESWPNHLPPALEYLWINADEINLQSRFIRDLHQVETACPGIREVNIATLSSLGLEFMEMIAYGYDMETSLCHYVNGEIRVCDGPAPNTFTVFTFHGLPYRLQIRHFALFHFDEELAAELVLEERLFVEGL